MEKINTHSREIYVQHETDWDEENYSQFFVVTRNRKSRNAKYEFYNCYHDALIEALIPDDTANRSVYGVRNKNCGSTQGQEDLLGYIEFEEVEFEEAA